MAPKKNPNPNRDDVLYGTNVVTDAFGTRFAPYGVRVRGGQQPITPKSNYMEIINQGEMAKIRPMVTKSGESVTARPGDIVTINGKQYAKAGTKVVSSKSVSREQAVKKRAEARRRELDKNRREA